MDQRRISLLYKLTIAHEYRLGSARFSANPSLSRKLASAVCIFPRQYTPGKVPANPQNTQSKKRRSILRIVGSRHETSTSILSFVLVGSKDNRCGGRIQNKEDNSKKSQQLGGLSRKCQTFRIKVTHGNSIFVDWKDRDPVFIL